MVWCGVEYTSAIARFLDRASYIGSFVFFSPYKEPSAIYVRSKNQSSILTSTFSMLVFLALDPLFLPIAGRCQWCAYAAWKRCERDLLTCREGLYDFSHFAWAAHRSSVSDARLRPGPPTQLPVAIVMEETRRQTLVEWGYFIVSDLANTLLRMQHTSRTLPRYFYLQQSCLIYLV